MMFECWLQLRGEAPERARASRSVATGRTLALTHNLGGGPGECVSLRVASSAPSRAPERVGAVPALIGTSGWHYQHWKGGFYPPGVAASRWLGYYAERFATVELNNAFYRLPEASTFAAWASAVPDGFVVAVKASRYLTHVRRLHDPAGPVGLLVERASHLGDKLGPVLLQLPPTLRVDAAGLDRTLAAFPASVRVAVEPRHDSWFVDDTRAVLESRGAALCLADGGPSRPPLWRTASWGYVRSTGAGAGPSPATAGPPSPPGPGGSPGCGRRRPTCSYISTTTPTGARSATPADSPPWSPGPAWSRHASRECAKRPFTPDLATTFGCVRRFWVRSVTR